MISRLGFHRFKISNNERESKGRENSHKSFRLGNICYKKVVRSLLSSLSCHIPVYQILPDLDTCQESDDISGRYVPTLKNFPDMPVIALLSVHAANNWVAIREYISTRIVCVLISVKHRAITSLWIWDRPVRGYWSPLCWSCIFPEVSRALFLSVNVNM